MAWTYTNQPGTVTLDAVRLLIGDVLSDDPQLTDEEINHFIASEGSPERAAVAACRALMALFARKVDKAVGDLKLSYSQRSTMYGELVKQLEARTLRASIGIVAGGISAARKTTVEEDGDRVAPAFYEGQFDQPSSDDAVS